MPETNPDPRLPTPLRKGPRSRQIYVLLNEEEMTQLVDLAEYLGWSRSAVLRYGLDLAQRDRKKLKEEDPPGNRRAVGGAS